MNGYSIRVVEGPQGIRLPVLVKDAMPMVLPNLWISSLSSEKPNTLSAYLGDLKKFYCALESTGLQPLQIGKGERRISKSQARAIAARIQKNAGGAMARSSVSRLAQTVGSFLTYLREEYVALPDVGSEKVAMASKHRILMEIGKLKNSSPSPGTAFALTSSHIAGARQARPIRENVSSKQEALEMRDRLLVEVALATGARRSELVLLDLGDFDLGPNPTVSIKLPTTSARNARRDGASVKTETRMLSIPSWLADLAQLYIDNSRALLKRRGRPSSAFFISSRDGARLHAGTVNQILSRVLKHEVWIAIGKPRLHPHALRSAAMNQVRGSLAESCRPTELQEVMTYFGGWKADSKMPAHYTRRQIEDALRRAMQKHIRAPQ